MEKTTNHIFQPSDPQVVVAEPRFSAQLKVRPLSFRCLRTGRASAGLKCLSSFQKEGSLLFLPLYSELKQYEVRWLFKPTNATWATSRGGTKVQSIWVAAHTLVWRQLCEEPVAAAPDGDEGSSSLDSFCSSLWRPRLMWLCRAAGVNHSLGRQLCRKGMQELKYASLLTQRGISRPHSNWNISIYNVCVASKYYGYYRTVFFITLSVLLWINFGATGSLCLIFIRIYLISGQYIEEKH